MKPTIRKLYTVTGRRKVVGYRAAFGTVEADGKTKAEAELALEKRIREDGERLERGMHVCTFRGHTFIVAPDRCGFSYWLDTFSSGYRAFTSEQDVEVAKDRALHHLAQNLWTLEADDAEFLASVPVAEVRHELAGWIRFQRAYAWLRAGGVPERDIHPAACALASATTTEAA